MKGCENGFGRRCHGSATRMAAALVLTRHASGAGSDSRRTKWHLNSAHVVTQLVPGIKRTGSDVRVTLRFVLQVERRWQECNLGLHCVWVDVLFVHLSDTRAGNKHRQNDRPETWGGSGWPCSCAAADKPRAALSQPVRFYCTWPLCASVVVVVVGRGPSPDSPDYAPWLCLHMPGLSLRDTVLSEEIHCMHEHQP